MLNLLHLQNVNISIKTVLHLGWVLRF